MWPDIFVKKKNTLDDTLEKDLQGKDGSRKICKKAIIIIQVRNNSNLDKGQLWIVVVEFWITGYTVTIKPMRSDDKLDKE